VGNSVRLMLVLSVAAPLPLNGTPFRPVPQFGFAVLLDGR